MTGHKDHQEETAEDEQPRVDLPGQHRCTVEMEFDAGNAPSTCPVPYREFLGSLDFTLLMRT